MGKRLIGSVGLKPGTDTGFDLDTKGQIHGYTSTQYALDVGTNNFVIYADSSTASGLAYGASAKSILSATGDILYASGANTLAKLAKGDNDEVLTLKSGLPSWESAGGGSSTIHSFVTSSDFTTASTSFVDVTDLEITLSASGNTMVSAIFLNQVTEVATIKTRLVEGSNELKHSGFEVYHAASLNCWSDGLVVASDSQVVKVQCLTDAGTLKMMGSADRACKIFGIEV